jgi:hypothetical protein
VQLLSGCLVERATALQFERQGYFAHDDDSRPERLVFNRTASLRESPGKAVESTSTFSANKTCCRALLSRPEFTHRIGEPAGH